MRVPKWRRREKCPHRDEYIPDEDDKALDKAMAEAEAAEFEHDVYKNAETLALFAEANDRLIEAIRIYEATF